MKHKSLIDAKIVSRTIGSLLFFEVAFMLFSAAVAFFYGEDDAPYLLLSAGVTFAVAVLSYFPAKTDLSKLGKREGYLIVTIIWIVFSLFGSLPFYLSGYIPSYTDAFFETISGFTTTGATILEDIERLPHGLLFWRSLMQWLGGMGIIVLSLAVLPVLGIGGMQLYVAEVPGPTKDRLRPRVTQTAKILWTTYALLTMAEALMLVLGGMSLFDAVCHSFTTLSTGGYSTKNMSVAYWDSAFIQYTICAFMFIGGISFAVSYYVIFKGDFKKLVKNEEFKYYTLFFLLFSLGYSLVAIRTTDLSVERAVREGLFQIISIMTGTGFATSDFMIRVPFIWVFLLVLMTFGGCAGSSCGGIKIVRIILLIKNSYLEFKRLLHPNAFLPVKFNGKVVNSQIVTNVLAFIVLFIVMSIFSMLVLTLFGVDFVEACGAVITCISNVGPGIGEIGPSGTYADFPTAAKWYLSFLMLTGRLEIFTVLFLLSPPFWKR